METDELISLIETAAAPFVPEQAAIFAESVRQDLAFLYEETSPADVEGRERGEGDERDGWDEWDEMGERLIPREARPQPPERYRDRADLWVVFSSFVTHFVDPIGAAAEVVQFASEQDREALQRIILTPDPEQSFFTDEIDIYDRDRLRKDYRDLVELADQLGQEAFGEDFRLVDFVSREVL